MQRPGRQRNGRCPRVGPEHLRQDGQRVRGLLDVDLKIAPGEALGLVGESGSGKSTLAKVLLGLLEPDSGAQMEYEGRKLAGQVAARDEDEVRAIQIVFQNPGASLNRRHSVRQIIGRAVTKLLGLHGRQREERLVDLTGSVRLGRIGNDYVIMPTLSQLEESDLDLVVSGTATD